MSTPVLSIRDLCVSIRSRDGLQPVVKAISFDVHAGEVLALLGESGCGKTKTAEAIMGLLARQSAVQEKLYPLKHLLFQSNPPKREFLKKVSADLIRVQTR